MRKVLSLSITLMLLFILILNTQSTVSQLKPQLAQQSQSQQSSQILAQSSSQAISVIRNLQQCEDYQSQVTKACKLSIKICSMNTYFTGCQVIKCENNQYDKIGTPYCKMELDSKNQQQCMRKCCNMDVFSIGNAKKCSIANQNQSITGVLGWMRFAAKIIFGVLTAFLSVSFLYGLVLRGKLTRIIRQKYDKFFNQNDTNQARNSISRQKDQSHKQAMLEQ